MTSAAGSLETLRRFAPGTPLRDAVDLILRQGTGALIVIGSGPAIDQVSSGGFNLENTEFTAQRMAELAKMDGGIVVDGDAGLIMRANVHFIPDPSIDTDETGTRFRTAERLALQTGSPVLAVSEEGRSVAIVYVKTDRHELRSTTILLAQANQALNSLERLRRRMDHAAVRLSRLEVDDLVTVRDVVQLLQRAALIQRLGADVERLAVELGGEAQLIRLQATDLIEGVAQVAELVYADYSKRRPRKSSSVFTRLQAVATDDLYTASAVAAAVGLSSLDDTVRPRGLRLLDQVPRLPEAVTEALVSHFGEFQKLLRAETSELDEVEGVGRLRSRWLSDFLRRQAESRSVWETDE